MFPFARGRSYLISIHAPRVGSDFLIRFLANNFLYFNPRSPCGERRLRASSRRSAANFNPRSPCGERPAPTAASSYAAKFQSTLPVWGATAKAAKLPIDIAFQSTLPVWGATALGSASVFGYQISIHAPRVGSDVPTGKPTFVGSSISIHAPRVGSDTLWYGFEHGLSDFNPRSPCGERQACV